MVRLNIEIIRSDRQSVVLELKDSEGITIDPSAFDSIKIWVKPQFQDKFYPEITVR